jgi:divalent metal cation (Fe/Co/Zn/Cd) transporter
MRTGRNRAAADGSARVVYTALAGNAAITVAKFIAYGVSGSSAMLTEAIHSLVDSVDQVLLLVGQVRGRRPADAGHPLGHGMESYFWSFIVAVMVLPSDDRDEARRRTHRLRVRTPRPRV